MKRARSRERLQSHKEILISSYSIYKLILIEAIILFIYPFIYLPIYPFIYSDIPRSIKGNVK